MTARLGSEYRYFGKLVLVPFRYFSIDTYRNIDIFDNTTTNRDLSYCAEVKGQKGTLLYSQRLTAAKL